MGLAEHKNFTVPFFRLDLEEHEIDAVVKVLRSGWLTTGKQALEFESEFATFIGGGVEALAVNSNTSGMHLALEALGIGPGDEVIVPTLTFTATAGVVRHVGANPVLVDVRGEDLCIDIEAAARAITKRTRAIMPVHFGGGRFDVEKCRVLADAAKLSIVEDAAHALPGEHNGRKVGAGDSAATVFSFYANKTITTGEGGMIVSRNSELIDRCRVMRQHGISHDAYDRFTFRGDRWRYDVVAPGYKYGMTDVAAALGRTQLAQANARRDKRATIAACYDKAFNDLPLVLPPRGGPKDLHSWHLYVVQLTDESPLSRETFLTFLRKHGIGYSVHYTPLHRLSYWRERFGLSDAQFPVASAYADRCVTLPLFPTISEQEVERVIEVVRAALS